MMTRESHWGEVDFGYYLRDKTGVTWQVREMRGCPTLGEVLLLNRDGQQILAPWPDTNVPVTIVEPTEDEALAVLANLAGAEVMGVQDEPRKPHRCPKFPARSLSMGSAHMMLYHAVWTNDIKEAKRLNEAHDEDHADPVAMHGYIPHTHNK